MFLVSYIQVPRDMSHEIEGIYMTFRNQVIQVQLTKVTEQNSPASYPTHTSKKKMPF